MSKTVNIVRPFTLNLGMPAQKEGESADDYASRVAALGPRVVTVAQGIQQLPDEVANHWFTKANSVEGQLDPKAYAELLRAQADAQKLKAKEAQALADEMDKQASEAESEASASGKEATAEPPLQVEPETPPPAAEEGGNDHTAKGGRRHTS